MLKKKSGKEPVNLAQDPSSEFDFDKIYPAPLSGQKRQFETVLEVCNGDIKEAKKLFKRSFGYNVDSKAIVKK